MVVQHNLTAMNANRYFGINNTKLSKSLEKLSSGYAINRAGDNAAGLAVSEKMRSQIAGLTQAVKNAQDGISMVQTFEGALTETDSILQRMKTLASQSANGTYQSEVDREAIELEFEQLNDELNQIADTDFNGVVVLNGGIMADGTAVNNTGAAAGKPTINYVQNGTGDNSFVYSEVVNGTIDASGNGVIVVNGVRVNLFGGASTEDNTSTGEAGAYKPDAQVFDVEEGLTDEGSEYTVEGVTWSKAEGFGAGTIEVTEKFTTTDTTITINGTTYTITNNDGQYSLVDADGEVAGERDNDVFAEVNVEEVTDEDGNGTGVYNITVTLEYAIAADGTITNSNSGDVVGSMKVSQGVSTSDSYQHGTRNLTYADSVTLQAGARSKDSINFNFAYASNGIGTLLSDMNVSARGLGTDQLTLATAEQANFAIDQIDNAINKVSMVRATFGAIQNRLEHKIDNLNVTTENLTDAESRIRDTDMATEMMNFTKNQILAQASQSMLAQANQLPQSVLQLLQ